VFREFEPVDVCRHIPLHVGRVVVIIVLNLFSGSSLQVYEVEPRGFEPLTSAVQRRHDTLLDLSGVCKIVANKRISALSLFLVFQEIYSGCCTRDFLASRPLHLVANLSCKSQHFQSGAGGIRTPDLLAQSQMPVRSSRVYHVTARARRQGGIRDEVKG
jgi:hypothetical protein